MQSNVEEQKKSIYPPRTKEEEEYFLARTMQDELLFHISRDVLLDVIDYLPIQDVIRLKQVSPSWRDFLAPLPEDMSVPGSVREVPERLEHPVWSRCYRRMMFPSSSVLKQGGEEQYLLSLADEGVTFGVDELRSVTAAGGVRAFLGDLLGLPRKVWQAVLLSVSSAEELISDAHVKGMKHVAFFESKKQMPFWIQWQFYRLEPRWLPLFQYLDGSAMLAKFILFITQNGSLPTASTVETFQMISRIFLNTQTWLSAEVRCWYSEVMDYDSCHELSTELARGIEALKDVKSLLKFATSKAHRQGLSDAEWERHPLCRSMKNFHKMMLFRFQDGVRDLSLALRYLNIVDRPGSSRAHTQLIELVEHRMAQSGVNHPSQAVARGFYIPRSLLPKRLFDLESFSMGDLMMCLHTFPVFKDQVTCRTASLMADDDDAEGEGGQAAAQ